MEAHIRYLGLIEYNLLGRLVTMPAQETNPLALPHSCAWGQEPSKEDEKYKAWLQLDFKTIDKNGNFEVKKFHQNYGFDLEKTLAKHPIKELAYEVDKGRLIESLQRGNRQSSTIQHEGKEQKIFIEAAPQFKSINLYDSSMKRLNAQTLYEKPGETQTEKQEAKKESIKKDKAGDDEGGDFPKQAQKRTRKKSQSIS